MSKYESHKKNLKRPLAEVWLQVFALVLVTELFWHGMLWMFADVFPEWEMLPGGEYAAQAILLLTIFVVEFGSRRFRHRRLLAAGTAVFLGGCFTIFIYRQGADLMDGMRMTARQYLQVMNGELQTNLTLPEGSAENLPVGYAFLVLVFFAVTLLAAVAFRLRMLLVLPPAIALMMDLIVGYAPGKSGIFCLFAGVMLLYAWEWQGERKGIQRSRALSVQEHFMGIMSLAVTILLAVGVFFGSGVLFAGQIEALVEKAPDIWEFQQQLEEDGFVFSAPAFSFSRESVDNRTPHYSGKKLFQVTSSVKPTLNLYLRGYYGSDYRNGSWSFDGESFETACLEAGYDADTLLRGMESAQVDALTENLGLKGDGLISYTLHYALGIGKYTYLPYFSRVVGKDYSFEGDYFLTKSFLKNTMTVKGWSLNLSRYGDELWVLQGTHKGEERDWVSFYNAYVMDQYLEVPDGIPSLDTFLQAEDYQSTYTYYQSVLEHSQLSRRNAARYNLAELVSEELSQYMTYSLELDNIRDGTDAVEYFLSESHEGYCKHFATAGVLLLRKLGVPARYMSGYVLSPSAFSGQRGDYQADVLDSDAHAWAEIYLEDIGWVPVEMTPGIGLSSPVRAEQSMPDPSPEPAAEPSPEPAQELQPQTSQTPEDGAAEENTSELPQEEEQPAGNDSQTGTGLFQTGVSGQGTSGRTSGDTYANGADAGAAQIGQEYSREPQQSGKKQQISEVLGKLLRLAGILIALVGSCALILEVYREARNRYHEILKREIHRGMNRQAVQRMNRRLYRRLLWRRKKPDIRLTDPEYESLLARTYPGVSKEDWKHYMEIVKEAAFSDREPSAESVQFCYQIYTAPETVGRRRRSGN